VKHKVALPVDGLTRRRLAAICPLSGATEGLVWRKMSFTWLPPGVAPMLPLGFIFGALLAATMERTAAGELPFRPRAWWRWKVAQVLHVLAWILGFLCVPIVISGFATGYILVGVVMMILAAAPVAGAKLFLRRSGIAVDAIGDDVIVLRIPNERAARALGGDVAGAAVNLSPQAARALEAAARKTTLAPERTRCAYHPDTLAAWCCGRCGSFFCPRCAEHPSKGSNAVCAKCFGVA
jgi:hypothetical protein